jgi:hypothetical protein
VIHLETGMAFTSEAIERAAQRLGVDGRTIKAVAAVESNGEGFLRDGRPKILFERHVFHRLTEGRFDASSPEVSNAQAGGYVGNEGEYPRLYRALQLDGEAAVQSVSWGAFQLMGFNWKACGEKSLYGFLLAMHHNEDAHLALAMEFMRSKGLAPYLQRRDWAGFAKIYNGPAYAKNQYDTKLAKAYGRAA